MKIILLLLILFTSLNTYSRQSTPQINKNITTSKCDSQLHIKFDPKKDNIFKFTGTQILNTIVTSDLNNKYVEHKITDLTPLEIDQRSIILKNYGFQYRYMDDLIKKYHYSNKTEIPVSIVHDLYLTQESNLAIVGIFTSQKYKDFDGFFVYTIYADQQSPTSKYAYLDYVISNPESMHLKGFLTDFQTYTEEMYRMLGMDSIKLEADWIGRYAWAGQKFSFDTSSKHFLLNGKMMDGHELAKHNFQVFLKNNDTNLTDIRFKRNGQIIAPKNIDDFLYPLDFATAYHVGDKKVSITPYLGENILGKSKEEMDFGKAFMFIDRGVKDTDKNIVIDVNDNTKLNTYSMPYWDGIRPLRQ